MKDLNCGLKKGQGCSKAVCSLCNNAVIDIATMGVCAFTSHAKGAKHQGRVRNFNPYASLFFKRNQASFSSTSSCPAKQSNASGRVDTVMNVVALSYAEIRWVMKVMTSHFSYCCCINLNSLLASMFPDRQIAKSFQMSKTKCSYYIMYSLALYYKEELIQKIKASPNYSILLDESLSHCLQKEQLEQLDVQIRFWDKETIQIQACYFDSRFFKRPNADNILSKLLSSTSSLPEKNMLVLSMDGSNTIWSAFEKLNAHREKSELPQILKIGSCGLHVIHGAFPAGVKATGWELDRVLIAMWKLFNDSSVRCDPYINLNRSDNFFLMFCQTRWVEYEFVASRTINVWKFVVSVNHYESLSKFKLPKNNKSYDLLVKHMTDDLMLVKFQFFKDKRQYYHFILQSFK